MNRTKHIYPWGAGDPMAPGVFEAAVGVSNAFDATGLPGVID